MAKPLSGGDLRVSAGIAGMGVTTELVVLLWSKKILSDDDALTIYTGAIDALGKLGDGHPAWEGAQNLLRMQATRFGGPAPGAKPS